MYLITEFGHTCCLSLGDRDGIRPSEFRVLRIGVESPMTPCNQAAPLASCVRCLGSGSRRIILTVLGCLQTLEIKPPKVSLPPGGVMPHGTAKNELLWWGCGEGLGWGTIQLHVYASTHTHR